MPLPVEKTFEEFVVTYGGELVSRLISNNNPLKNADYLFRTPLVVAGLKVVERDAFTENDKEKLQNLFHSWVQRRLVGPAFGRVRIELRKLPRQCQQEWLKLHMAPWKKKLENANKQIKTTKTVLNLSNACGILFLCDDADWSFPPEDVLGFLAGTLQSKKPDGNQVYSHIDRIVYFSMNPKIVTKEGVGLNFWMPAYRQRDEDQTISGFLDNFRAAFAQYHASLLGTKPVQLSPQERPFKDTWPDGLHGFRVR
jgi:hypothetical protein